MVDNSFRINAKKKDLGHSRMKMHSEHLYMYQSEQRIEQERHKIFSEHLIHIQQQQPLHHKVLYLRQRDRVCVQARKCSSFNRLLVVCCVKSFFFPPPFLPYSAHNCCTIGVNGTPVPTPSCLRLETVALSQRISQSRCTQQQAP